MSFIHNGMSHVKIYYWWFTLKINAAPTTPQRLGETIQWKIIKVYVPISLATKCACGNPGFLTIGAVSHTLLKGVHKFLRVIFIYWTIWMKFHTEDLHVTPLNICEFHENRRGERRTFVMGINEITFYACTVKPYDVLKANIAMVRLRTMARSTSEILLGSNINSFMHLWTRAYVTRLTGISA